MIAIISCAKSKVKRNGIEAKNLYSKSYLFRLSYSYIKKFYPYIPIYILSAKYGLIKEDTIVDYYERTLNDFSKRELMEFAKGIDLKEDYIFIGGKKYLEVLGKRPVKNIAGGLPIGKKIKYLRDRL